MFIKSFFSIARRLHLTDVLSDETFLKMQYYAMMGKHLNLTSPTDFNEKIQWLKLHFRNPLYIKCADKYLVREYVRSKVGVKYLNECLGVYESVDSIDFETLPEAFVLKASHGSGWNIICPDKSKLNIEKAKKRMAKWLNSDFSQVGREWQYHEIMPRIICERFLVDPECPSLRDYKLFTFKGETKYIWVDFVESAGEGYRDDIGYSKPNHGGNSRRYRNIYDINWRLKKGCGSIYPSKETESVSKPECLQEMLDVAYKLAKDFPMCRVDFYVLGGRKVIFGELTFTPGNGCNPFYPQSFNDELGSYINLASLT